MENNTIDKIIQDSELKTIIKTEEVCDSYIFRPLNLLIPPINIFSKLCLSTDKTHLFIISLTRVITLFLITKLYYELIKDSKNSLFESIFSLLSIYTIFNILLLIYIINKTQLYPKIDK